MKKLSPYLKYLSAVLRHKYYVYKLCSKCGMRWRGLLHDTSKLSLKEFPYSALYYCSGRVTEADAYRYDIAWLNHVSRNKHHWQYWIDLSRGSIREIDIPPKYVAEMICDWYSARIVYGGEESTVESMYEWYVENRKYMKLSPSTHTQIYWILSASGIPEMIERLKVTYRTKQ